MEWDELYKELNNIKIDYDRSYKSLSRPWPAQQNTVNKHAEILVTRFNTARILIHDQRDRLNKAHWTQVSKYFNKLRDNLIVIKQRYDLTISVPTILNPPLKIEAREESESSDPPVQAEADDPIFTDPDIEEKDINNLTIPAVLIQSELSDQESTDSDSHDSIVEINPIKMAQTNIDFINTASKLIPVFDGKAENLTSFIDALEIIESIKGENEQLAVSIIKTKLKGVARNLIGNETTITEVISRLKNNVKGETVEVLSTKLMNLQQRNKAANQYTQEVEQMTKSLEGAYITDGLSLELARSYSTRHAVKAMTKNCTIDKVKTIMQAGTFNTMNEAI